MAEALPARGATPPDQIGVTAVPSIVNALA